ncbi:hypothetical protein F511_19795 [Dorcoceras hygrometricum]|uniref:Uncharacterized protein n=1 Tax=Dorcoceras hygrometricum TaxID=472368 RepID=A0A2Z7AU88_9LAMI|nr:hypothetical protein F511_19795 [Dorcoceras hygrometricum]
MVNPAAGMVNPVAGIVKPDAGKQNQTQHSQTRRSTVKPDAGRSNQTQKGQTRLRKVKPADGRIKGPTLLPRLSQKNYSNLLVETLLPSAPAFYQISIKLQTTALFCTDIYVVIWVYGIFRTLGYLV